MKKFIAYLLLSAALPVAGGCSDDSEVFYSISYPVVRVEAVVAVSEDDETTTDEDSESEGSEESNSGSEGTDAGSEETTDSLADQIQAEVLAEAPVQAGGCYTLDFTRYNRGPLTVDTASENGTVVGGFIKEPGASEIQFFFLDLLYTCSVSSYTDTDGVLKVLFTTDLTEEYQERYPSADLTQVSRREYTSTPYN